MKTKFLFSGPYCTTLLYASIFQTMVRGPWSSRSDHVVLQKNTKQKLKFKWIACHTIAENLKNLGITRGNRLLLLLPVLIFYEIYYPTHLQTSLSTLSNKSGTITPKRLYARKECDLAELLTPLTIHTLLYPRK